MPSAVLTTGAEGEVVDTWSIYWRLLMRAPPSSLGGGGAEPTYDEWRGEERIRQREVDLQERRERRHNDVEERMTKLVLLETKEDKCRKKTGEKS